MSATRVGGGFKMKDQLDAMLSGKSMPTPVLMVPAKPAVDPPRVTFALPPPPITADDVDDADDVKVEQTKLNHLTKEVQKQEQKRQKVEAKTEAKAKKMQTKVATTLASEPTKESSKKEMKVLSIPDHVVEEVENDERHRYIAMIWSYLNEERWAKYFKSYKKPTDAWLTKATLEQLQKKLTEIQMVKRTHFVNNKLSKFVMGTGTVLEEGFTKAGCNIRGTMKRCQDDDDFMDALTELQIAHSHRFNIRPELQLMFSFSTAATNAYQANKITESLLAPVQPTLPPPPPPPAVVAAPIPPPPTTNPAAPQSTKQPPKSYVNPLDL